MFGLAGLFVIPIVAILAMITVIGAPLGLAILLMVWPAAAFAGYLIAAIWIGDFLLSRRGDAAQAQRPYLAATIGIVVLWIVSFVPFVGAIASLFGFGAVLLMAWRTFRQPTTTQPAVTPPATQPMASDASGSKGGSAGAPIGCAGRLFGQPGYDRVDDIGAFGLVVELVAQSRERPPFDSRYVGQHGRGVDRHQAVILAVEDQRRDPEPTRCVAAHACLLGEPLDPEPRGADLHARGSSTVRAPHRWVARQGLTTDPVGDLERRGHPGDADGQPFLPARQGRISAPATTGPRGRASAARSTGSRPRSGHRANGRRR